MIDAHCHSVRTDELTALQFAQHCTESRWPAPAGSSYLESPLGLAIRRWCAPVLDLPALAPMTAYLDRRTELGGPEVSRRLLQACGLSSMLVDTGYLEHQLGRSDLHTLSGVPNQEIARLESIAEILAPTVPAKDFANRFRAVLAGLGPHVVGFKSVLAYRHGFGIDPERPTDVAVTAAVREWRSNWTGPRAGRLEHPVLLRFVLWEALMAETPGPRPVQLHVGYGDSDIDLDRTDPTLLTEIIRRSLDGGGAPLVLLHCYPYHRQAAYLAAVYPNVYLDIGLAAGHLGAQADRLVAEALEIVPFGKLQYSSDGCHLAELFLVGARAFTEGLDRVLRQWVEREQATPADTATIRAGILDANARRLYPGPYTTPSGDRP